MVITSQFDEYADELAKYVRPTPLHDCDHAYIRKQANELVKGTKTVVQAITAIHAFVASFPLGYDREDLPASAIMRKHRGQCNTKTTLFIALCRAVRIPTRPHAWWVHKKVHKPNMSWLVYVFTSKNTLFTYPEVWMKGKWVLLTDILKKKSAAHWEICPFDDAAHRSLPLKKEWIAKDLGGFWSMDKVIETFGTNSDGWRRLAFPLAQVLLNK